MEIILASKNWFLVVQCSICQVDYRSETRWDENFDQNGSSSTFSIFVQRKSEEANICFQILLNFEWLYFLVMR